MSSYLPTEQNNKTNTKVCLFCCKPVILNPISSNVIISSVFCSSGTDLALLEKFTAFLTEFNVTNQNVDHLFPSLLSNSCLQKNISCCEFCSVLINQFCEDYQKIKDLEAQLEWRLSSLASVIQLANQVPERVAKLHKLVDNEQNVELMTNSVANFRKELANECNKTVSRTGSHDQVNRRLNSGANKWPASILEEVYTDSGKPPNSSEATCEQQPLQMELEVESKTVFKSAVITRDKPCEVKQEEFVRQIAVPKKRLRINRQDNRICVKNVQNCKLVYYNHNPKKSYKLRSTNKRLPAPKTKLVVKLARTNYTSTVLVPKSVENCENHFRKMHTGGSLKTRTIPNKSLSQHRSNLFQVPLISHIRPQMPKTNSNLKRRNTLLSGSIPIRKQKTYSEQPNKPFETQSSILPKGRRLK